MSNLILYSVLAITAIGGLLLALVFYFRQKVEVACEIGRSSRDAEIEQWRTSYHQAEQQVAILTMRLQEQQSVTQEKLAFLGEAREQFAASFKALAGEILEEKSKRFSEQNITHLGQLLSPLREQLGEFRKTVTDVYDKESRERTLLKHEIDTLKNLNQRISDDAINLTRALKGESRTQGAWGELILERLLEASGLQKGREYEVQVSLRNEEGGRPRPDVLIHLPEGRNIVIDAKVSLTAYERYCTVNEENERKQWLRQHVDSLRSHVKDLAERRYSDLTGINSLDFVLMFVPVEAAYIEAVRADDGLHTFALDRHVVIVTTSTLLATLRTVASLWRFDDRNRNAFDIADRAGKLYDKFVGFVADLERVESSLQSSQQALGDAMAKLSSAPGNLVGQVEKLKTLGAKAAKSLDARLVGRADSENSSLPPDL